MIPLHTLANIDNLPTIDSHIVPPIGCGVAAHLDCDQFLLLTLRILGNRIAKDQRKLSPGSARLDSNKVCPLIAR